MRHARGDPHVSVKDESCNWRTLALGIASLLTQMPEQTHQEDMLNVAAWIGALLEVQRMRLGKMPLELLEVDLIDLARDWADGRPRAILRVRDADRDLPTDDLPRMPASQTSLDLELDVAREVMRLHGGDLWAEQHRPASGGGGTAIVVLPLHFSRRSHAVLARGAGCSRARLLS
jgi:hypothetical protein